MKISEQTWAVLKNFAAINPNLTVTKGKTIRTIDRAKAIYAEAEIPDSFPRDFGLWDLEKFLSMVSTFKDPEIEFNDHTISVKQGASKFTQYYCDPDLLTKLPNGIRFNDVVVTTKIGKEDMSGLTKRASILNVHYFTINSVDGKIVAEVKDINNPNTDKYSTVLEPNYGGPEFNAIFNIGNVKVLPGDYEIHINNLPSSMWFNKEDNVKYFIGLEKESFVNGK